MKRHLTTALAAVLLFSGLLIVWLLVIHVGGIAPYLLPSPMMVLRAGITRHVSLLSSLAITATEAAAGLMASILVGVVVALVFAQARLLRRLLYPYTLLLQTVPIVAIAPLILMWVGAGTFSVALIAFIICLAPIIANTTQGLISVDRGFVDLFRMHGASRLQTLMRLRLPHALPSLFAGVRISSGIAVIGAITGELFAGSARVGVGGLGYAIQYASAQLETDYLFALVVAATALGFCFFFAVSLCEWATLHRWHESARLSDAD